MVDRPIFITQYDKERLVALLAESRRQTGYRGSEYLEQLENELERAQVVPSQQIPPDVITMNSQAMLTDTETGEEMVFTLVFPQDADIVQGKISILAPVGTAMLGYRVGDTFSWKVPDGVRNLQVKEIYYQPEAKGDFDL